MTGLLICAAVVAAMAGWATATICWVVHKRPAICRIFAVASLALIAVALWLAYAAGGA